MSHRSRSSAMALAFALVLSVAATAAADEPLSHTGSVGKHSLTDSRESSGARCIYNDDQNLARLRVEPPTVFARSRTSSRDRQWVGWRVEAQHRDGGAWQTVQMSAKVKIRAWDDSPAAFRTTSVVIDEPVGSGEWRVVSRMTWYDPNDASAWQGTARHLVEHYTYPLADPGEPRACPAGIL